MMYRLTALVFLWLFHGASHASPVQRDCLINAWDKVVEMYTNYTGCKTSGHCGTCNLQELSTSDGSDVQIGEYGVSVFACTVESDNSAAIYYYVGKLGNKRTAGNPCPLRLYLDSVRSKQN